MAALECGVVVDKDEFGGRMYFYGHQGKQKVAASRSEKWTASGGSWRLGALPADSLAMDALCAFGWGGVWLAGNVAFWHAGMMIAKAINISGKLKRARRWEGEALDWAARLKKGGDAKSNAPAPEKKDKTRLDKRQKEIARWIASRARASAGSVSRVFATAAGSAAGGCERRARL